MPKNIALQLDVAIVREALILNRLGRLSESSKQAWLRGLLIQGFQIECRAHQDMQRPDPGETNAPRQQTTITQQAAVEHRDPEPQQETDPHIKPIATSEQTARNIVSFAALRKVIG